MARFCVNCGMACNEQQMYCSNCNRPLEASHQTQYEPPMKWYKFIIYFQLFAFAVILVLNAVQVMLGTSYGSAKGQVYKILGGLESLDATYGLICLGLAGFALYVRSRLRWRKRNGPKMYYILLALDGILPLIYLVAFNTLLGNLDAYAKDIVEQAKVTNTLTAYAATSLCRSAVWLVCNGIYFRKRRHFFGAIHAYGTSVSGYPTDGQQRPQGGVPAGGWTCDCGRTHAAYVTSCTCGLNKTDIQKRKAAAEADKASETAKAAETAKKDDLQDQIQAIKSYKELLDAGILTQEEFDVKKKELLGL